MNLLYTNIFNEALCIVVFPIFIEVVPIFTISSKSIFSEKFLYLIGKFLSCKEVYLISSPLSKEGLSVEIIICLGPVFSTS
ncbi:hypothetical protein AAA294_05365 [Fusobacterium varium]|uniref:hypothetical protein n=1 Tax=Fusobacterium varium TaxID=856 RepID=UPI0032C02F9E